MLILPCRTAITSHLTGVAPLVAVAKNLIDGGWYCRHPYTDWVEVLTRQDKQSTTRTTASKGCGATELP